MGDHGALDKRLAQIVQTDGAELASLAVVASTENELIYQGYFGSRYIDAENPENNFPVNADTKFRIASISKSVATLGAMQLVERRLLDLDRDVSDYLRFELRNPNYPDIAITCRMLVSHTSSIRDASVYSIPLPYRLRDFFLPDGAFYEDGAHLAASEAGVDPIPGQYFCYCNLNFGVLGTVMEAVSGERFDKYMAAHVLQPLGIDGGYNVHLISDAGFANIAALYRKGIDETNWSPGGPWIPQVDDYRGVRPVVPVRIENPDTGNTMTTGSTINLDDYTPGTNGTLFSPQGGLRISAPDLAKIMQVLMNGGRYADVVIVQPKTIEKMLSVQWAYDGKTNNGDTYDGSMRAWGLGLQRTTASGGPAWGDRIVASDDIRLWGHGGNAYGLLSGMWFDPEASAGLIFMIGGLGANPDEHTGVYSSFARWEEQIMTAVYEEVLKPHFQ